MRATVGRKALVRLSKYGIDKNTAAQQKQLGIEQVKASGTSLGTG